MKPYYYVYRVGYDAPKYKHATLQSAQAEAERLSAKHPGNAFEILKCIGISSVPAPKASTFWMDEESPPDGEAELPFPDDFPELPPLPKGRTRWVYLGANFHGVTRVSKNRIVRFWAEYLELWFFAGTISGSCHHIEAI